MFSGFPSLYEAARSYNDHPERRSLFDFLARRGLTAYGFYVLLCAAVQLAGSTAAPCLNPDLPDSADSAPLVSNRLVHTGSPRFRLQFN